MRNLAGAFTMRKDGVLPRGDWFKFVENKESAGTDIYIYDEIGFWGTEASEFVKQLNEIKGNKINLHLNSPGGEIFDGFAIFNALKQHKATVTTYVDGLAASAASFIAQAGDEVIMARNATMMIHDGIAMAYGNAADLRETAELLDKISDNIADVYAYAANRRDNPTTLAAFRALMKEEVWYTGAEAVAAGLADTVLDQDDKEAEEATNKWDLSFYNHAGRARAESPTRIAARLQLSNNAKENNMGDAPATDPAPETPDPNSPDVPETPAEPTPAAPAPAAPATPAPATPAPENKATTGMLVNGVMVTDPTAIQAHITALETAHNEARDLHRKEFVDQLATDNKILASALEKTHKFANGLTDEQFSDWSATWSDAPAAALLGDHGTTTPPPAAPGNTYGQNTPMTAEAKADRISVLQGIVAMNQRTMSDEQVKSTPSYAELQSLLGTSNES